MITGEIKNRIDTIWDTFWTGGITNSIAILERIEKLEKEILLGRGELKKMLH